MGISGPVAASQKRLKKWRLFRATDYVSLMWPCFEISRIHGLFPYKITSPSTIAASKPGYIYSTFMTGLNIALTLLILYEMDISRTLMYDSVPGSLQGNCYLLLGWSVAMVSYINSAKRMRLLGDLAEVAARLPASSFTGITKLVHAKDILGFLFLVGQTPNVYSSNLSLFISKALDMYITLVVYLMDTLYVDSVCVLRACFERINENLLALKDSIETEEPHLLRRVYHEQKNPLILLEIRAMKKQHNDVSEVVQRLNSTFSLQIVATVTLTFAEITFSLYFYILAMIGSTDVNLEKQIWYSYFITSVTYYAVKLASIVWACETAKGQALRTGIIVHEVLIDTTDKQVKEETRTLLDGCIRWWQKNTRHVLLDNSLGLLLILFLFVMMLQLQLFSLQLLHRDNTFQAKGLSLDATLITAIVGGITTYLLILIQFLVSSKSCGSSQSTQSSMTTVAP